ncbi:hypothetical protein HDU86_007774 [Geranomyces michiganensis]|nr:hypothetical protein HDU86_007774 [Geranomyces michiganensis]
MRKAINPSSRRAVVVSVVVVLCIFALYSFTSSESPASSKGYFSAPWSGNGVASVAADAEAAASLNTECQWVEPKLRASAQAIQPLAKPEFSLLEAWLKPEAARYGPALKEIPPLLKDDYTFSGKVPLGDYFLDQAYLGGKALESEWSEALIEKYRQEATERKPEFNYPNDVIYASLDEHQALVKGKRGLVIGSEIPWLEGTLLAYGAEAVSTLEFGTIDSKHPQITTYTPKKFSMGVLQQTIAPFDFVFSYSSIEHDGLGRYGDNLNPFGDMHTMAKMLTTVKPGGFAFIGFPCCYDRLDWNAHRVYGPLRLPKVFAGWKILGVYPEDAMEVGSTKVVQPVWVLQNTFGCRNGGITLPNQPWLNFPGSDGIR